MGRAWDTARDHEKEVTPWSSMKELACEREEIEAKMGSEDYVAMDLLGHVDLLEMEPSRSQN